MKLLSLGKAMNRRRFLRGNIALGLLVFIIAVFLTLTGEYTNLGDRQAAESLYNYMAFGGLIYAALAWMICVMSKPFWFPLTPNQKIK